MIKVSNELMDNWNVILNKESIYNAYLSGDRHNSDCFLLSKTYFNDIQLNITNLQLINGVLYADINEVEGLPMNVERVNVEDGHLIAYYMEGYGQMSRVDLGIVVGPKGDTGNTPDISVGIVTTGNPGTNASVNISGTKEEPVLNFTIPRGNTGEVSEEELDTAVKSMASPVYDNANGDIATFSDGADDVAVKSLVAEITPVQSGSGDPSPTNIRPISGRTGLTVTRAGKNLCPSKTISMGGTNGRTVTINLPYTLPAGEYIMSYTVGGTGTRGWGVEFYYNNTNTGRLNLNTGKVSLSAPTNRIYAYMVLDDYNDGYTRIIDDIQLEVGSTATAYEPYAGQTYPVTWESSAGTIYGGTLDVVSGVLTVDRAIVTITAFAGVNEKWSNSSTIVVVSGGQTLTEPRDGTKRAKAVSNMLPNAIGYGIDTAVGLQDTTTPCFGFNSNDTYNRYVYARFPNTIGTTIAEVNAYLAENPLVIAYAIQTPQTYQITPTEVRTILGGNTIYTDAGSVSVDYVADTGKYIDNSINKVKRLIAGIETTYVASRNYNVGDFLVVNNDLLKVISAIASGETIVIGTNANITTVAEQLILLFNS